MSYKREEIFNTKRALAHLSDVMGAMRDRLCCCNEAEDVDPPHFGPLEDDGLEYYDVNDPALISTAPELPCDGPCEWTDEPADEGIYNAWESTCDYGYDLNEPSDDEPPQRPRRRLVERVGPPPAVTGPHPRAPQRASGRPRPEPLCTMVRESWAKLRINCRKLMHNPHMFNVDDVARHAFKRVDMPPPHMGDPRHSHGSAANQRSRGIFVAEAVAHGCGRQVYSYQMSAEDVRQGRAGYRKRYWAKDFRVEEREDVFDFEKHVRMMIDVDYYMENFEHLMATEPGITVLYTFAPTKAASTFGDTSWTFTHDNQLESIVNGITQYKHKLWDFAYDNVTFRSRFGMDRCTYLVERVQLCEHHACILFAPVFCTSWWQPWFCEYGQNRLRRFEPVMNGIVTLHIKTKTGEDKVSMTQAGHFTSLTIDYPHYLGGHLAAMQPRGEINIATQRTWIGEEVPEDMKRVQAAIWQAIENKKVPRRPALVCPVEFADLSYSCNITTCGDGDEGFGLMQPFMSPLDNRGFTPRKGPYTDKWGVTARVLNLIEKNSKLDAPRPSIVKHLQDFVNGFRTTLYPVEVQRVYDNQTRPTQKMQIWRAGREGNWVNNVSAFVKAECYASPKDPRIITQFAAGVKIEYATFAMALADYLKSFPWYGFKKPCEIAEAVAASVANAAFVIETDFSRFDGHVTDLIRKHVDIPMLMMCFPQYQKDVIDVYNKHRNNTVRINDLKFNSGDTQSSGSADTSVMNTLRNRAIIYCAWRAFGLDHGEAFNAAGMHGGDDGLVPIPKEYSRGVQKFLDCLEVVCRALGMEIECVVHPRGVPFTFLARYFNSWYGDLQSCCDVQRQVKKLHMSVGRCPNPGGLLREKALAYLLTDANTPLLGELCTYFVQRLPKPRKRQVGVLDGGVSWWSQFDIADQFPNAYREWMWEVLLATYPEFSIAEMRAGIAAGDDPLQFRLCVKEILKIDTKVPLSLKGDVHPANNKVTAKNGTVKTEDETVRPPPKHPKATDRAKRRTDTTAEQRQAHHPAARGKPRGRGKDGATAVGRQGARDASDVQPRNENDGWTYVARRGRAGDGNRGRGDGRGRGGRGRGRTGQGNQPGQAAGSQPAATRR